MVNQNLKPVISPKDFVELNYYITEYDKRHFYRLRPRQSYINSMLGHHATFFLMGILQRSRFLYLGFTECDVSPLLGFLAARAHMETTGAVCHVATNLSKYYANKLDLNKLQEILDRSCLGSRYAPLKEKQPDTPEPINCLTLIDAIDTFLKDMGKNSSDDIRTVLRNAPIRKQYDFLSEVCHPNSLGLVENQQFGSSGIIFPRQPKLKKNFNSVLTPFLISCKLFFVAYDYCFKKIKAKEEMPDLDKESLVENFKNSIWRFFNRSIA
ncbi:MAG: hypothetical protein HYT79_03825 [Elusimicrobia bacterium]|nr:hypothetical protein [Elusimicrobiota bacterium]